MIRPIHPGYLRELLKYAKRLGEPSFFRMHSFIYADIRKFGRDELDIYTSATLIKQGLMAKWNDIELRVTKLLPLTGIEACDSDGLVLTHDSEGLDFHPGTVLHCLRPECEEVRMASLSLEVLES